MKNKILLATAVAMACGAPVAAMADANIYGQFRYSLNSLDADNGAGSSLSGQDNVSLFGIKAEAKGDSVTAFAHLQTGATANENDGGGAFDQRFYFGGLKGDFGTVAYGRMTNAYKMPGFKLDPFYNLSHVGASGTLATGGATYGLSGATNGFTDNALQYTSPSMSGLKVNVGLYMDDTAADDHGTGVGLAYSAGDFNVGLQFASNDTTAATVPGVSANGDALRLHGGYKASNWTAGFSYETVDNTATTDIDYMYLVGTYSATKETTLALTVGMVGDSANGATEGTGFNAAVMQAVAPKTQVYAAYSTVSLDNVAAGAGKDPVGIVVGAIHKF